MSGTDGTGGSSDDDRQPDDTGATGTLGDDLDEDVPPAPEEGEPGARDAP